MVSVLKKFLQNYCFIVLQSIKESIEKEMLIQIVTRIRVIFYKFILVLQLSCIFTSKRFTDRQISKAFIWIGSRRRKHFYTSHIIKESRAFSSCRHITQVMRFTVLHSTLSWINTRASIPTHLSVFLMNKLPN